VKTVTIEEAVTGLGQRLERAMAGEAIRIRKGNALVELRPVTGPVATLSSQALSPREALQLLQAEARLTPQQAERYLGELREDRLAAAERRWPR
jgi:hypothetical protein